MHDGVFRTRNLRDLGASSLDAAIAPDLPPFPVTRRHREIARAAILVHDELASLAAADPFNKIPTEARQMAQALQLSEQDVASKMSALLRQHRDEWRFFLHRVSTPEAWVRQFCR